MKKNDGFELCGKFKFFDVKPSAGRKIIHTIVMPLLNGAPIKESKMTSLDPDDKDNGEGRYRLQGFFEGDVFCDLDVKIVFVNINKVDEPVFTLQSFEDNFYEMLSPYQGKYVSLSFFPDVNDNPGMKRYDLIDETAKVEKFTIHYLSADNQINIALEFSDGKPQIHLELSPEKAASLVKNLTTALKCKAKQSGGPAFDDLTLSENNKKKLH